MTVAVAINLLSGIQNCWSLLSAALMEKHGWTITQVTLPYSLLFIVAPIWTIVVGYYGDRTGPNFFVRLGALCYAAGLIIAGKTDNWVIALLAVGIFLGIASSSISNSTSPTAIRCTPPHLRGFVTGIVGAGIGWTTLYMAPLIAFLLRARSTETAFLILGVGIGASLLILSFLLPNPVKNTYAVSSQPYGKAAEKQADTSVTITEALRKEEVLLLFFIFFASSVGGLMITSQVTAIAKVQANIEDGYILVVTMGVANGFGRIITPSLSDRIGILKTWGLVFFLLTCDLLCLPASRSIGTLMVSVCVLSFFSGSVIPLMWSTVSGLFGNKQMGTIYGLVNCGYALAAIAGPALSAQFAERSGSYSVACFFAAGISMLGLLSLLRLGAIQSSA